MTTSGSKPKFYLGSISEGTLRNEDLIPIFLGTLETLNLKMANEIDDKFGYTESEDFDYDSEEASDFLSELTEALDDVCPPFVHFGSHEGDGACFGFWPEPFEEIRDFGEDVAVYGSNNNPPEFIVHVTDHGNMTLYRVTLEELWSVV